MTVNSYRSVQLVLLAVSVLLATALLGVLVHESVVSPSSAAGAEILVKHHDLLGPPSAAPSRSRVGVADGVVADRVTVFDETSPAVVNLDPDLLGALRLAATQAADEGVVFVVNSGWRSAAYQEQLLREAIAQYGSADEAARWVATPATSAHVSGDAVDIGPAEAASWLSTRGAEYGLCQIYTNEPWHFELRPDATNHGCPLLYADPTEDPRMQK
ncbi:peptidase M15 [Mycolicibacterium wolinskyi]|uniref:Peptidase M15 n=1 Tax=Mycolicibacterium wolinskyi TaxID=59750 RepID=A0A132PBW1_9MYCO|nr:M15 family metallopeptidase [Mycolicibacterium wolinskyi]KWX19808.1 peptidase M15 [Mycolicibacterium wolinskyi]